VVPNCGSGDRLRLHEAATLGTKTVISGGLIMEQTFGWKNMVVGLALTIVIVCSACAVAFS
jgi:hypothetical protein